MLGAQLDRYLRTAHALGVVGTLRAAWRHVQAGLLLESLPRLLGVLLLLLLWPALPLLWLCRVRLVTNHTFWPSFTRIGHLAAEPDCFVKESALGWRPAYRGVLIFPRDRVANPCLLDYWRRYFLVVSSPFWARVLSPCKWLPGLSFPVDAYVTALNETASGFRIQAAYRNRPAVLELTADHRRRGEARLRELGVPPGAWFVAVHCREGGYDAYDARHADRNAAIANYLPALRRIVAQGGWCVRMGDPSMTPLPPLAGVIDYAHHPLRCDWMDIFLCARCRFFLGSASGLAIVANVFGSRACIVNQALPALCLPYGCGDLLIPKLLHSTALDRYLTFPEIAQGSLAQARHAWCYDRQDVIARDNAPEDIEAHVVELLEELAGRFEETADDRRRQEAFHRLLRPGHYSFGAVSRIGRRFLRKYESLLEPPAAATLRFQDSLPECGTPRCPCELTGGHRIPARTQPNMSQPIGVSAPAPGNPTAVEMR
jgi:putative glycosyltransferase (TIGR04372 family)